MTRSRLRALAGRLTTVLSEPAVREVVEVILPDNGRGPPPGRHPLSAGVVLVIVPADGSVAGETNSPITDLAIKCS